MDVQLPSLCHTRLQFRNSLGWEALRTRAESGGKINVLMKTEHNFTLEGKRKNPKDPEAFLSEYRCTRRDWESPPPIL